MRSGFLVSLTAALCSFGANALKVDQEDFSLEDLAAFEQMERELAVLEQQMQAVDQAIDQGWEEDPLDDNDLFGEYDDELDDDNFLDEFDNLGDQFDSLDAELAAEDAVAGITMEDVAPEVGGMKLFCSKTTEAYDNLITDKQDWLNATKQTNKDMADALA